MGAGAGAAPLARTTCQTPATPRTAPSLCSSASFAFAPGGRGQGSGSGVHEAMPPRAAGAPPLLLCDGTSGREALLARHLWWRWAKATPVGRQHGDGSLDVGEGLWARRPTLEQRQRIAQKGGVYGGRGMGDRLEVVPAFQGDDQLQWWSRSQELRVSRAAGYRVQGSGGIESPRGSGLESRQRTLPPARVASRAVMCA